MRIVSIIVLLMLGLTLIGCETLFMKPNPGTSPQDIFEEAWTFTDQEYSFFSFKGIDWDSVRTVYEPQVRADMTDEALFDLLADMLFTLRDGHVNLRTSFDRSRNWTWFLDYPPNYNEDVLERFYWKNEQQFVGPFVVYDFGDVGYARYASFSNFVSSSSIDYIVEQFDQAGYKGLILDMRSNGGGSTGNVGRILGRFTDTTVIAAQERNKVGPGHEEFGPFYDFTIEPLGDTNYTKPVILLTNRLSYSATNFFATATKAFPNITIMGDTTGGGGGAPSFIDLANGWNLRVSNTQLFDLNGFNVEDGVPPDVHVQLDSVQMQRGVDSMLELALEMLRE